MKTLAAMLLLGGMSAATHAAENAAPLPAHHIIFDIDRNPDLITSHAGRGLPDIRFAAEPRRTGSASMRLDLDLPDRSASGRWLLPLPHLRFREISFWVHTGGAGNALLELSPTLLGARQESYIFRPVRLRAGGGWQNVRLRLPEDVLRLERDPDHAEIGLVPAAKLNERSHLMFTSLLRLAKDSPPVPPGGCIHIDQIEFFLPGAAEQEPAPPPAAAVARIKTGADAPLRLQYTQPGGEMAFFIVDDGAGRWIPTACGISTNSLQFRHRYTEPGKFARRWISVGFSGNNSPWHSSPVDVTGQPLPVTAPLAARFSTTSSPAESESFPGADAGAAPYDKLWISARFDAPRPLESVRLKTDPEGRFPAEFEIETTADGGKHWLIVPSARFDHFPNPGNHTVEIPLHGVVADGLRVVSFYRTPDADGAFRLALGGIETTARSHALFEASGADPVRMAAWNNLWLTYGSAENEIHERFDPTWPTGRPFSGGMLAILATEWSLWNAMKLAWCDSEYLPRLAQVLAAYPVDDTGYAWVTTSSEKHLEHSRHYVATPIYISAVSYYYLMTRDKAFIESKDPKTGELLLSKLRRAMRGLTDELGGSTGLVTVKDPELQGTPDSKSNTYWDAWPFGHQDAYMNAYYYQAAGDYAGLLEALGENDEAARFRTLQDVIRRKFNETFWDEATGRYIGWIDKNGKRVDFGFVFLNLKVLAFGLAPEDRARRVMEWIDGKRAIPGDTATGADIYHYKVAPRSTTLAAESVAEPYFKLFWNDSTVATKDSPAAWGLNAQNGGMILYTSYYDLHARLLVSGPDDALARMNVILDEAATDQLRRMPKNPTIGIGTPVGILREFPESGLVPFYFVDGILGLQPVPAGLRIAPAFPEAWGTATVRDVHFAGKTWDITADHAATAPRVESSPGGPPHLIVPANQTTLLTPEGTLRTQP